VFAGNLIENVYGVKIMVLSDRKKEERNQRREAIIDAAEILIFKKGYDNVSMNDIAIEVELNRATIYLYFNNKEAVCFAVILRGMRILNDMVKKYVNKRSLPIHKINAIASSYYMFFQRYPQYFKIYYYFQSGRFELERVYELKTANYKNAFWDVEEIIKLQKEIFNILFTSIEDQLKTNNIIDLDPLYATIFVMSTLESMLNPPPVIEMELKNIKNNEYQNFNVIFLKFINNLLNNP